MYGRYGTDELNLVLMILGIIVMFLSRIFWFWPLAIISYALYIYALFRMFSRNIQARYAENQKFLQKWGPVSRRLHNAVLRFQDRKTHRYFKCPNCHKRLRVPKGRGKITITCPHCRTQFVRKS